MFVLRINFVTAQYIRLHKQTHTHTHTHTHTQIAFFLISLTLTKHSHRTLGAGLHGSDCRADRVIDSALRVVVGVSHARLDNDTGRLQRHSHITHRYILAKLRAQRVDLDVEQRGGGLAHCDLERDRIVAGCGIGSRAAALEIGGKGYCRDHQPVQTHIQRSG